MRLLNKAKKGSLTALCCLAGVSFLSMNGQQFTSAAATPTAGSTGNHKPVSEMSYSADLKRLNMLIEKHSFQEADDLLDQLSSIAPDDPEIKLSGARLYRNMGMVARSMTEYKEIMERYPTRVEAPVALSEMYQFYLDPRKSLIYARQAVAMAPEDERARVALTSALISSGYLKEADEQLKTLRKLARSDAQVHHVAYKLFLERGEIEKARGELEAAIDLVPKDGEWLIELSDLCKREGDYKKAKVYLQRAIDFEPYSIDKLAKMALLEEYSFHDYDEAIAEYQKVLQVDPDSVSALAGIDRCKAKENDVAAILKDQIRGAFGSIAKLFNLGPRTEVSQPTDR